MPNRLFLLLFTAAVAGLPPTLLHASVEAVTVYPDRATVVRTHELSVGPGVDRLRLDDLPIGLDRDSVRVRATGPAGLRIGALDFEILRGSERVNPAAEELERRIESLEDERGSIADRIAARDLQLGLLQRLASASEDGDASPTELLDQLERLGGQADRVYAERRTLLGQQQDLNEEIERLRRQLADLGHQQRDALALGVALEAPNAGTARFTIEYTIGSAAWRPVYEWRLDTERARMTLVQSAEIRQATGEDWSDARVAVSLARPARGGQLPYLSPWWIDVIQPRPQLERRANYAEAPAALDAVAAGSRIAEAEADFGGAELAGTALTQRYDLPGRIAIPSDNQPHRFRLDEQALDVTLTARAVPQRQAAAWTFVETTWSGDAALPPGPVQLYQDGASMGRTNFAGVAPGGTIETSFGVDDRIEIEVDLVRQDRQSEGLINKRVREIREHRWTLTNRHARPIDLTLLGQLPVARDERIEVELTDGSQAPDRRDIDDQPGRVAWDRSLAPGETLTLTVGISVSWPESLEGIQGW